MTVARTTRARRPAPGRPSRSTSTTPGCPASTSSARAPAATTSRSCIRVAVPGARQQGGEAHRARHRAAVPARPVLMALAFLVVYICVATGSSSSATRPATTSPRCSAHPRHRPAGDRLRHPDLGEEAAAARGLDPGPARASRPATRTARSPARRCVYMVDELGIQRRPLLKGAIALGLLPVGVVAAAPLIGGLIQNPHKDNRAVHVPHRLQPGRERRQEGPADPRGRHARSARRTSASAAR